MERTKEYPHSVAIASLCVWLCGSMTYAPTTNAPTSNSNVEAYINPNPNLNPNPNPNP